jgi:serine phosphatase RsbU (regulator of sigma subunit)
MTAEVLPLFAGERHSGVAGYAFDVDAVAIPAKSFTGDFYYVERCQEGLWFALGDVAGKGLPAAVVMAMIQEELENAIAVARRGSGDPATAMWRLDRAMHGILPSNRFATAIIGRIDPTGMLVVANAGHCPPLLATAHGVESIASTGPAIAILPRPAWSSVVRPLQHGDSLVIYSDGVIEATDAADRELGDARLKAIVASMRGEEANRITRAVRAAVTGHAGEHRQDDLTVVAIRLL